MKQEGKRLRLTEEEVVNICQLMESGEYSIPEISSIVNVSRQTLYAIRYRSIHNNISQYFHIENVILKDRSINKNIERNVRQICSLLSESKSDKTIAELTGNNVVFITKIRRGIVYKKISKEYSFPEPDSRRLSKEMVHKICSLLEKPYSITEINKMTKVCPATICGIRDKEIYRDISNDYKFYEGTRNGDKNKKLPENKVIEICKLLENKVSVTNISKLLQVGKTSIYRIKNHRRYTEISKDYNF